MLFSTFSSSLALFCAFLNASCHIYPFCKVCYWIWLMGESDTGEDKTDVMEETEEVPTILYRKHPSGSDGDLRAFLLYFNFTQFTRWCITYIYRLSIIYTYSCRYTFCTLFSLGVWAVFGDQSDPALSSWGSSQSEAMPVRQPGGKKCERDLLETREVWTNPSRTIQKTLPIWAWSKVDEIRA